MPHVNQITNIIYFIISCSLLSDDAVPTAAYSHVSMTTVVYLTCTMALGTCSVCLTVLVLNLHHRHIENKVPRWAKIVVLKHLSRILCMTPRRPLRPRNMLDNADMSIRDGIRRIAQDMQVMNPMLTPNGRDIQDSTRYRTTAPPNDTKNSDTNRYRSGPYTNIVNHSNTTGGRTVNSTRDSNSYIHHHHHPNHRHSPMSSPDDSLEYVNEWRELAHVLDRLFFWIVFFCMTLSTLIIILTPLYQSRRPAPEGNNTVI